MFGLIRVSERSYRWRKELPIVLLVSHPKRSVTAGEGIEIMYKLMGYGIPSKLSHCGVGVIAFLPAKRRAYPLFLCSL